MSGDDEEGDIFKVEKSGLGVGVYGSILQGESKRIRGLGQGL